MAGERRHQQDAGLLDVGVLAEMKERAEGMAQQRHFADRDRLVAHHGAADAEIRPLMPHPCACHHLASGSRAADHRMMARTGQGCLSRPWKAWANHRMGATTSLCA